MTLLVQYFGLAIMNGDAPMCTLALIFSLIVVMEDAANEALASYINCVHYSHGALVMGRMNVQSGGLVYSGWC